jgi:hypothetical protein
VEKGRIIEVIALTERNPTQLEAQKREGERTEWRLTLDN